MNKSYLGDGVYVEFDESGRMIKLTTSDGTEDTNTIYLEWEVWMNLYQWVGEHIDRVASGK